MKPPPSLKTAMTPFPYSIQRSASLEEARQLMDRHDVRHLPVTDRHELVGLVSDRDLRFSQRRIRSRQRDSGIKTICKHPRLVMELRNNTMFASN